MTPTDAREQLINADDSKTYQVIEERWYHSDTTNRLSTSYSISILPGLDGTDCSQIRGPHLEVVLADSLTALKMNNGLSLK